MVCHKSVGTKATSHRRGWPPSSNTGESGTHRLSCSSCSLGPIPTAPCHLCESFESRSSTLFLVLVNIDVALLPGQHAPRHLGKEKKEAMYIPDAGSADPITGVGTSDHSSRTLLTMCHKLSKCCRDSAIRTSWCWWYKRSHPYV